MNLRISRFFISGRMWWWKRATIQVEITELLQPWEYSSKSILVRNFFPLSLAILYGRRENQYPVPVFDPNQKHFITSIQLDISTLYFDLF